MKKEELQNYLHEQIPATRLLGFTIKEFSKKNIAVHAGKYQNSNVHGTGFAGSISTVLIMSGWLRAYHFMLKKDPDAYIVLASCSTDFFRPVVTDLVSTTPAISREKEKQFISEYRQTCRSRLEIESYLGTSEKMTARFKGTYYIRKKSSATE